MSQGEMDLSKGIKENIVSNHVFLRDIKNQVCV